MHNLTARISKTFQKDSDRKTLLWKKRKLLAERERNAINMAGQVKSVRKKNRLVRIQVCAGFLGDLPSTARLSLTTLGSSSWDNVLTTHRASCCLGLNSQIDIRYYILGGGKPPHRATLRFIGTREHRRLNKKRSAGWIPSHLLGLCLKKSLVRQTAPCHLSGRRAGLMRPSLVAARGALVGSVK